MTPDQARLFTEYRVHCFFCPATVTGLDPEGAHRMMESHYAEAHDADIERVLA